ncbi:FMN-binding negative transcriptional regulator [Gordonia polyisoprenivorans]|uniref:FMN-binding negative transcriptional regulator n=1 Tax=Gordonia TaxID=2053 RepID=UPI0009AD3CD4|nr:MULTISPECIES: FMN-binding negative transcriptional regulator [Gordonia]MDF3281958.1 FMN-binding negative transcriptional regulator [Gordonia sp. N1V]OPX15587.1 transcriptional regulator [Gordonia sp. i37]QUD85288.1 FMN-binding negative transcriptional regulator [Gordonia polyisoprenivorans]UZF58647.1 FMN-binding negative transcriptional regulator [Gordonia polyisoprenivorans]
MYVPPGFALSDEQIAEILDGPGLAQLVSVGASGLVVTPLPLIYDRPNARLLGHMAKANPHWREATTQTESVAIFPISDGYISPSLYATKAETGRVVPTWNYETVHVHGRLRFHTEHDWLHRQVSALTELHERSRDQPWAVTDAPAEFIDRQLSAIVGVELSITRWAGKAKMSQNQPERNRRSVVEHLSRSPIAADQAMARRIARRSADRRDG